MKKSCSFSKCSDVLFDMKLVNEDKCTSESCRLMLMLLFLIDRLSNQLLKVVHISGAEAKEKLTNFSLDHCFTKCFSNAYFTCLKNETSKTSCVLLISSSLRTAFLLGKSVNPSLDNHARL